MTTATTLPVILKMARHPERMTVSRVDRLFVTMAMVASDKRTTPRHRLHLLRAIFRLMKRVEPSESLSPKLANVWMTNVFAVAFKRDPRTTDMQSVLAIRLLFDVEVWVGSQPVDLDVKSDEPADHPPRAVDLDPNFRVA